ncbi:MAG: SAM-dependent methyltransferase, partial [Actinomycetota bacterium]|nr:SAM-dependent methyltransferase [Actinomycetota bacterium]
MTTRTAKKKTLGSVAFVGAGPGDPELLTVRAVELLRQADVVVVDQGASRAALTAYVRPEVEVVDASSGVSGQPLTHAARAKLVIAAARRSQRVVRLMDGDPILFHGFPEEAGACGKAGIAFEVVPGASSVTAVPAYAGVPLTTAKVRSVHVVTSNGSRLDWSTHTGADTTVVALGDSEWIASAAAGLVAAGRDAD